MNVQQFIQQFGEVTDPNVKFIKAGNTVIKSLADLLTEYASLGTAKAKAEAPAPVKKVAGKTKKK